MPNLAKLLKDEIQRLARKETKAATATLRSDNTALKRAIVDHKRRLATLEKDNRRLLSYMQKSRDGSIKASDEEIQKARITAKMIRGLRDKFGLSQVALAEFSNARVLGESCASLDRLCYGKEPSGTG